LALDSVEHDEVAATRDEIAAVRGPRQAPASAADVERIESSDLRPADRNDQDHGRIKRITGRSFRCEGELAHRKHRGIKFPARRTERAR
jgi:hypothetical protein